MGLGAKRKTGWLIGKSAGGIICQLLNSGIDKSKIGRDMEIETKRIETLEDVAEGLEALALIDPRLAPIIAHAGDVPLRRMEPGFAGMVGIIVSQQISRASADAIMGRLKALLDPVTAEAVCACNDETLRQAGLSRPKQRTLVALAQACQNGNIDLDLLAKCRPEEVMAQLTAMHGIGPWTAEIYLLFALGHPDIFPARDVALQIAVGHGLEMDIRPGPKDLLEISRSWAPWRSVAARLFWAYYHSLRGREGAPAAS